MEFRTLAYVRIVLLKTLQNPNHNNSRLILTKDGSFFYLPPKVALLCDCSVSTVSGFLCQPT